MSRFASVAAALMLVVSGRGPGGGSIEVSVLASTIQLDPSNPSVLECDPPLQRTLGSASVLVDLDHQWKPEDPWDHISVEGIGRVEVSATLVSSSGVEYSNTIAGMAGGQLNLRFDPEVPADNQFSTIRLESSAPLKIRSVVWHLYNPK